MPRANLSLSSCAQIKHVLSEPRKKLNPYSYHRPTGLVPCLLFSIKTFLLRRGRPSCCHFSKQLFFFEFTAEGSGSKYSHWNCHLFPTRERVPGFRVSLGRVLHCENKGPVYPCGLEWSSGPASPNWFDTLTWWVWMLPMVSHRVGSINCRARLISLWAQKSSLAQVLGHFLVNHSCCETWDSVLGSAKHLRSLVTFIRIILILVCGAEIKEVWAGTELSCLGDPWIP